jgi:hypothetical protein
VVPLSRKHEEMALVGQEEAATTCGVIPNCTLFNGFWLHTATDALEGGWFTTG